MGNSNAGTTADGLLAKIKENPGSGLSVAILISHWAFFPLVLAHFVVLLENSSGNWTRYHSYPGEGFITPLLMVAVLLMTATKISSVRYGNSKSRIVNLGIMPFEVITLIASAAVAWVSALLLLISVVFSASANGLFGVPTGLWHAVGIYLFLYWFVAYGNDPEPVGDEG